MKASPTISGLHLYKTSLDLAILLTVEVLKRATPLVDAR
jgi:hypothetical protein